MHQIPEIALGFIAISIGSQFKLSYLKIVGAALGVKISHSEPVVQKYLGLTLIPQAGVAIGLATLAMTGIPEYGKEIQTIILSATVIYELIGPVAAKLALKKAGEIENSL